MKGIFCLEGMWDDNLKQKSTVQPILHMLEVNGDVRYIHHDVATVEELEFYLSRWKLARYRGYPILYLAFHGEEEKLFVGDIEYNIDRLGEMLSDSCANSIVMLASCSTLNTDKRNIKRFLRKTRALAICGYKSRVNWILSAAFEILVLSAFQETEFSGRGISTILRQVKTVGSHFSELEFTMITRRELQQPIPFSALTRQRRIKKKMTRKRRCRRLQR